MERLLPLEPSRQGVKSRVVPQRREPGIDQEIGQHGRALLVSPLEIAERPVALAQAGVHQREPIGGYVASGGGLAKRVENGSRPGGLSGDRVDMAERRPAV